MFPSSDPQGLAEELSRLATELQHLRERNLRLTSLFDVARRLGAEHDVNTLLDHVMNEVKQVTEADRCSLFLVDKDTQTLWTKIAQGTDETIRVPLGQGLVGECAHTRQIIHLTDAYQDPRFNREVDKASGYRTRGMLCVPMLDDHDECTGVIQALNKTRGRDFTEEDRDILLALGGVTAVAVHNALLHAEINALVEGFIRASVYAIEARDPTTSGHSERVAILCEALAEAVNERPPPGYEDVHFSPAEIRELRFAALLHDFGKVGVRENVLVKANKLHPDQLAILHARFEYARKSCDSHYLGQHVQLLEPAGLTDEVRDAVEALYQDREAAQQELDAMWDFILRCNRPTVLEEGGFERLQEIAGMSIEDMHGGAMPLLTLDEATSLSVRKGSLTARERKQIEDHVTFTWRFLRQIPWTRDLQHVPTIAYQHHERLNGRGYPRGMGAEHIPVQARIMALADVYDALTATDRPYKAALPHQRALDILGYEVKDGGLDGDLLDLFVACRAHERLLT